MQISSQTLREKKKLYHTFRVECTNCCLSSLSVQYMTRSKHEVSWPRGWPENFLFEVVKNIYIESMNRGRHMQRARKLGQYFTCLFVSFQCVNQFKQEAIDDERKTQFLLFRILSQVLSARSYERKTQVLLLNQIGLEVQWVRIVWSVSNICVGKGYDYPCLSRLFWLHVYYIVKNR